MLSDFTIRQTKAATKPYALADGDGLFLHVSPNGTKAWHFRFSWASKRDCISFGTYPALGLKQACDINPHSERKHKRHAIVAGGRAHVHGGLCPTAA